MMKNIWTSGWFNARLCLKWGLKHYTDYFLLVHFFKKTVFSKSMMRVHGWAHVCGWTHRVRNSHTSGRSLSGAPKGQRRSILTMKCLLDWGRAVDPDSVWKWTLVRKVLMILKLDCNKYLRLFTNKRAKQLRSAEFSPEPSHQLVRTRITEATIDDLHEVRLWSAARAVTV